MPRTLPAALKTALDSGTFQAYFNIQIGNGDGLQSTTDIFKFEIRATRLSCTFYLDNLEAWEWFYIERGAIISDSPVTISTSKFFITYIRSSNNIHTIKADLLPNISLPEIDASEAFGDIADYVFGEFDKTYSIDEVPAGFPTTLYPPGSTLRLNDSRKLFSLVRQKYLLSQADAGDEVVRHRIHSFAPTSPNHIITDILFETNPIVQERYFISHDEDGDITLTGDTSYPAHNLGFYPSGSSFPNRQAYSDGKSSLLAPNLEYLSLDKFQIPNINDTTRVSYMEVIERFDPDKDPSWSVQLVDLDIFTNTPAGSIPESVSQIGNYINLNTSAFRLNLDASITDIQRFAERTDQLKLGVFNRNLTIDWILADGESLVLSEYINLNDNNLELQGDAALHIL